MQLLAAVNDFVFQIAFNCRLVDDILLASVSQSHEGSSKQAQVPVPWPESNCASSMTR